MKRLFTILIMMFITMSLFAFGERESDSQKMGEEEQESIMRIARLTVPTPEIKHFLTRKAVARWIDVMDQPGKIFYIYIMSDVGTITHYFVAEYRPVSVATYLTPTEKIYDDYDWGLTYQANSLDGVYYGEGAAEQYFFFDAESGAYIELKGLNYIASDQPFKTEAPRLVVQSSSY